MATINNTGASGSRASQIVEGRTIIYALAAQPAGDVLQSIQMYRGEVVMEVITEFDALGAGTAIVVGDGNVTNRFITSTATTSAGKASTNAATATGRGYQYTVDDTIDVVLSGGAGTGNVRVTVLFVRNQLNS